MANVQVISFLIHSFLTLTSTLQVERQELLFLSSDEEIVKKLSNLVTELHTLELVLPSYILLKTGDGQEGTEGWPIREPTTALSFPTGSAEGAKLHHSSVHSRNWEGA